MLNRKLLTKNRIVSLIEVRQIEITFMEDLIFIPAKPARKSTLDA
jgi:hypothetical protein